ARMVTAESLTATGDILGTVSYLAPEQILGEPVSPSTDVYALGVVAYQCLTLSPPFVADSPVAVALMHTRDAPPPLPAGVRPAGRGAGRGAWARGRGGRWPSAAAMAGAASAAASGDGDALGWAEPGPRPAPVSVPPAQRTGPTPPARQTVTARQSRRPAN